MIEAHALRAEEVLKLLKTSEEGLADEEAQKRLKEFGPNEIEVEKPKSPLLFLARQFTEPLVLLLIAASLISLAIGEVLDASMILAIVFMIALLGFFQEYRAERALQMLKKLSAPTAQVVRRGVVKEIPTREVVPGDVLLIEAGTRVAADARLIECHEVRMDESVLTGESTPVPKSTDPLPRDTPVADRANMVFAGTHCTYGRGKAVVVATGMRTEFGKIAEMLKEVEEEKTPLQKRLESVGKWLIVLCVAITALVTVLGLLRVEQITRGVLVERFVWGVSLAVAAVPEALPAVVTISLAVGVHRMVKRNAIVRRLYAVETLGSVTVICSDKTGTITENVMTVREIYAGNKLYRVSGTGYETRGGFSLDGQEVSPLEDPDLRKALEIGVLCNDAQVVVSNGNVSVFGDPTEVALIFPAIKAGISQQALAEKYPRVREVPFSSERKRMCTVHRVGESFFAYVKGAPEVVLELCRYVQVGGVVKELSDEERRSILEVVYDMASRALRVLAVAYKELGSGWEVSSPEDLEKDLVFVGLQGMIDPPRKEVYEAVERCKRAGIKVVMITGDHKLTAVAVAKEVGILSSDDEKRVLTGAELDEMSDEELLKVVDDVIVYARVSPEHKVRIVDALKKRGHVVAMTGDGVNDAPVVKRADVGVAMGIRGTDVTKEASEIVLTDDNFASIVAAVEEGRGIFDNIKKYLMFLLSCNVGEVSLMAAAAFVGLPLPLVAIQILLINLLTDGLPAIALSVDPPDPDIMERPPRDPREGVFTKRVNAIIAFGGFWMALVGVLLFSSYLSAGAELIYAQTVLFWWLAVEEMGRAFTCRSERYPSYAVGFFKNKYLVLGVASSIALALLIIYHPIAQMLCHTTSLSLQDLVICVPIALTSLVLIDLGKVLANRFGSQVPTPSPSRGS